MARFVLSTRSFNRLYAEPRTDDPSQRELRRYYAVVPISDIPSEWANWLEVNARDSTDKGKVPTAIRTTLSDKPEWFAAYNRGLTVVGTLVNWDNKTNQLILEFDSHEFHGVLDGGHTLHAILDDRERLGGEHQAGFCNIEIFTGLDESEIPSVVEARNTSKQVASKSLMNLDGSFEGLKHAIGSKASLISWKENEDGQFDVREVVAILTALDPSTSAEGAQPVVAYSGKEACLKRLKANPEAFEKLYGIAGDALEMWDAIQYYLPDQYNKKGPEPGNSGKGGKFGRLTGIQTIESKPKQLPFIGKTTNYNVPTGYIYPVISAFRAMLEERDGMWVWGKGINPLQLTKEGVAADIFIRSVRDSINNFRNPNRIGKDSATWTTAYLMAENYYLRLPMV